MHDPIQRSFATEQHPGRTYRGRVHGPTVCVCVCVWCYRRLLVFFFTPVQSSAQDDRIELENKKNTPRMKKEETLRSTSKSARWFLWSVGINVLFKHKFIDSPNKVFFVAVVPSAGGERNRAIAFRERLECIQAANKTVSGKSNRKARGKGPLGNNLQFKATLFAASWLARDGHHKQPHKSGWRY